MATNRLYRDKEQALLGGVCAGIANRFDLDPTLVRVAVIALAVLTVGTTTLLYLAAWIIMPAGPNAPTMRPSKGDLTEEFRDASTRVTEAGRIVGRAARQAADDISALQRRPVAPPPVGDEAAGAQAVNEDVLSDDAPRPGETSGTGAGEPGSEASTGEDETVSSEPSFPETYYPGQGSTPPPPPPSSYGTGTPEDDRPPQPPQL